MQTGVPIAVLDATAITDMQQVRSPRSAQNICPEAQISAISAHAVRLIGTFDCWTRFDFEEIRVHSRRPESHAFGERLSRDLDKQVIVTDNWESCL